MRLVDTHCHLNFDSYIDDLDAVISRAAQAGVTRIVIPAIDITSTREGLALAARYPGVYAAAGLHPNSSAHITDEQAAARETDTLGELARGEKIVAIGEIGLDYHWDNSPKEAQFRAFEAQLALAARLELPVIIHNRDAGEDVIAILEAWARTLPPSLKDRPGVMRLRSGRWPVGSTWASRGRSRSKTRMTPAAPPRSPRSTAYWSRPTAHS
jgi:TatD DNase family protein